MLYNGKQNASQPQMDFLIKENEMEKRTWHYLMEPTRFEMHCDKCEGGNIEWSEYARMIWCYDCEIDTEGYGGIFDGPIPIKAIGMLGISFDRYNMETDKVERFNDDTNEWIPASDKEMEKMRIK